MEIFILFVFLFRFDLWLPPPILVFSTLGVLSPTWLPISPPIPMPRERGNPKRGSAYYNFVARHCRPGPSSAPVPPPISNVHPVGPSLDNSPFSVQNQLDDDKAMAYVEEEFSQAPPQAPPDSFLFSASDILIPPHTSGQHSLEGEFTLEMENFLIEEDIPIYWFADDLRKYNFFIYKKKYSRGWGYKSIVRVFEVPTM